MMSEPILFTNPQSRGRIAHWMLEESGIAYETQWVSYGPEMKSPAFLSINPMGKVPALKHGDHIVTECAAICAYMADVFPQSGLAPSDQEKADYWRWMFFAAGPLEQAVVAKSMGWETSAEKSGMLGFGNYALTLDALEAGLKDKAYICGDRFTAADVYVGSHLLWGSDVQID